MPLYCSNTGSTALRDSDVQQPITDATLSFTRSLRAFSAKVGQSLAPSSWMNLILRPSTPPAALICSIASFSACTEPVSLIAMVPVTECRMPTVTSVSVTARPVVLTAAVGNCCARALGAGIAVADKAAAPVKSSRRVGLKRSKRPLPDDISRLSALIEPSPFGSLMRISVSLIVAMQHTSFDVYAYAELPIKVPTNSGQLAELGPYQGCAA